MNMFTNIVCLVLLHSVLICFLSGEETGYPCFPADQCQNETNATFTNVGGNRFCCRAGDAINVTVSGDNFNYQSSSFFYRSLTKRDADNSSSLAESKHNITTTCTCRPVDPQAWSEDFFKSLQEMRKNFWSRFPW